MADLKKGDKVRLKSGGPLMTISDIGDYSLGQVGEPNDAKCIWFDGKRLEEAVFDIATLEKSEDGPGFSSISRA